MILYRACYFLLKVFLHTISPFLDQKLKLMLQERLQDQKLMRRPPQGSCIWIHAASGEIEYAKPLMRDLKKQNPEVYILVTYFSPSIKKLILNNSDWDALIPLPFDTPKDLSPLFEQFNPKVLLYARTDVWPELSFQARKRHVYQILFSATFAQNSSRLKGLGRWLTKLSLSHLDEVHCVSEMDKSAIASFNLARPALVCGDTRYDQVQWRLQNQHLNLHIDNAQGPVWIIGSSWPEDEAQLWEQLLPLVKQGKLSLIIAPHEISRVGAIQKFLLNNSIEVEFWSQINNSNFTQWNAKSVLMIDQIGFLAALYKYADIAFIGGSYKYQVHSVMEALAACIPVLVGPYFQNNREAVSFLNRFVFLHDKQIQADHYRAHLPFNAEELRKEIASHLGATRKLKEEVTKHL